MKPFSGLELKQLREEAGFTQKILAIRLGISRETVSAIERGIPETINSLDILVIQKWFKVCKSSVSSQRRESFIHYITNFFSG